LDEHNRYRAIHGSPPLRWNPTIAAAAQRWANNLAQSCQMVHNTDDNYGENLGVGYRSWTAVIGAWYNEESQYNYNNPGFSSATGHFTAVVWKSTTDVGCASATCGNGRTMWVCQYSPPGNSRSRFPENVCPRGGC